MLDLVGVVRECNLVGKIIDSLPHRSPEGRSRSSGNIGVRGRPVQQKFGRTGSSPGGTHQRCRSRTILDVWVRTLFQQELDKVEVGHVARVACIVQVGHVARVACIVQGRGAVWDHYSVDVGAVFNKLFC